MWLEWAIRHDNIKLAGQIPTVQKLLELTKTRDATVWNEKPFELGDIASTVAGCTRTLLVGSQKLLDQYHLVPRIDLRSKFQTNVQAYQWLIHKYGTDLNQKAVSMTVPYQTATHNPYNLRDVIVADKIFTFWTAGSKETALPGANPAQEKNYLANVLVKRFPANIMCLGYPWSGDGFGPGEWDGITFLSNAAKWLVATDNFDNLSFWTCFPPSHQKLPQSPPAPKYVSSQKYGAIVMSDGDNACTFQQFFPDYWNHFHDDASIGWTMAPCLADLAPPIYDYCATHIPKGSTVGTGVSGIGYMSLQEWGKDFGSKRNQVIDQYLTETKIACSNVGEKWLWIMRYGQPGGWELKDYSEKVPNISAIMGGYGKVSSDPKDAVEIVGHTAIFNCLLNGGSVQELEKDLTQLINGPDAPQFYNIFTMNWGFGPKQLQQVIQFSRSHGIELVTPEQLAKLAIEAHR